MCFDMFQEQSDLGHITNAFWNVQYFKVDLQMCKGARKPCIFPMLAKFCTTLSTALFNFLFKRIFVNKIQTMLDCLYVCSVQFQNASLLSKSLTFARLCLHALMTSSYTSKTHLSHPNYKWGFDLPIFSKLPSKFGVAC